MTDKMLAVLGLVALGLAGLAAIVALAITDHLGGDVESLLSTVISGSLVAVAALTHGGTAASAVSVQPSEDPSHG